jgi:hypothetical protein
VVCSSLSTCECARAPRPHHSAIPNHQPASRGRPTHVSSPTTNSPRPQPPTRLVPNHQLASSPTTNSPRPQPPTRLVWLPRRCPGNLLFERPDGLFSCTLEQYYDFSVLNLEFQYLMLDRATLERGDGALVQLFTVVDLAGVGLRVFSWNVRLAV